jgi:hypothetical protein
MMPGLLMLFVRLMMALALYAFLGYALWLLWREHHRPALKEVCTTLQLTCSVVQTQSFILENSPTILGSALGCEIYLDDPSIAAQHARLCYEGVNWWVENLATPTATLVNEQPVTRPQPLNPGDKLRCGEVTLVVSDASSASGLPLQPDVSA